MEGCSNNFATLPSSLSTFFGVTNTLIGSVSFLGNIVIFYVFLKERRLRNRSSFCLLSLAMSDWLVGAALEPLFIAQLFVRSVRDNCGLNNVRRFFTAMLMGASMSSIALISYDRYIHLSKTTHYNLHMTKRKLCILIFLCWTLPGLSPLFNSINEGHGIFSGMIFVYTFAMLFVITGSYFMILKIVKQKEVQVLKSGSESNGNDETQRTQQKLSAGRLRVAKAISFVILCFVMSNAPLVAYLAIVAAGTLSGKQLLDTEQFDILYCTIITISLANSTINPVIYYFRIPGFKEALLRRLRIRKNNKVSFGSTVFVEHS
eukprot:Seg831.1 transcript_id=Seg831.1/GoldUCD/mRNA.D3Y31 product=Melanopsin protein_id=Seg831.1/GoldUCD/D3Y31